MRVLKGYNTTATASVRTSGGFKNVNNQKAIGILPVLKDQTNTTGCSISLYVNGALIVQDMDIISFSSLSKKLNVINTEIPKNAEISYEYNNSVGSDIDIDLILVYDKTWATCKKQVNRPELLIDRTINVSAAADAETTSNFSVSVGRGSISSLEVIKETGNYEAAYQDNITVIVDGEFRYENVTAAIAFDNYAGISNLKMPLIAKEGAEVEITVDNNSLTAKEYYFNFGYNGN